MKPTRFIYLDVPFFVIEGFQWTYHIKPKWQLFAVNGGDYCEYPMPEYGPLSIHEEHEAYHERRRAVAHQRDEEQKP